MPVTCTDLKDLAVALAVESSEEAALRASISRAYYSAYHSLLPLITQLPPSARARSGATHVTHEELSNRLGEWKVAGVCPSLARLAPRKGQALRALDAARASRVKADYHLGANVTLGEAEHTVERARLVLRITTEFDEEMAQTGS